MINLFLVAAFDLATVAYYTWLVIKVAIGLGAVIFVHELGHFLVAKACGVKCEKFFIGFDVGGYKISRRWGETEYGIGIVPLGGYVKMLGQDDDPAHIAEQMKKSQIEADNSNAVEVTGPRGEKYFVDRRSYLAKSVPQRMAIISAGVVMNVIFAFIFAAVAYGIGVPYQPSIVSGTIPGSPAWKEGIEPGDEIIKFGNRENPTYLQLRSSVTLGDQENGIPTTVLRAADGKREEMILKPDQGRSRLATIGVLGPQSLELRKEIPFIDNSSAARATLVSPTAGDVIFGPAKFQSGDKIIRVGDVTVKNYREFTAELARHPERTLKITVLRAEQRTDASTSARTHELTFEVQPTPMQRLGLVMKIGPIVGIQSSSPAEQANLKAGDIIEKVDGQAMGGFDGLTSTWDPVTLPEYIRKAAIEGRDVEITVVREGEGGETRETIQLKPHVPNTFNSELPERVPMGVSAAGFAYRIENEVVAIRPGTPAAAVDVRAGDKVINARFFYPKNSSGEKPDPVDVAISAEKPNVPAVATSIQFSPPSTEIELTIERAGADKTHQVKLAPTVAADSFVSERGFVFQQIEKTRIATSFPEQIRYGWDETIDALLMVYRFLQKLGGQVPFTALGGPVTIAKAAGMQAAEGFSSLLIFLTMLSANLAVINFLPIPILDGGHMVFLAYEGIRGRPANERFVVAMHMIGFAFIATLMLFVLGLDFGLINRGF